TRGVARAPISLPATRIEGIGEPASSEGPPIPSKGHRCAGWLGARVRPIRRKRLAQQTACRPRAVQPRPSWGAARKMCLAMCCSGGVLALGSAASAGELSPAGGLEFTAAAELTRDFEDADALPALECEACSVSVQESAADELA